MRSSFTLRLALASAVVLAAACQDVDTPLQPDVPEPADAVVPHAPGQVVAWFQRATPDVLSLPETVFADHDETTNQLVIGIEHPGVANGVRAALARNGVPASAYRVEVTQPIHFAATLRDRHRPTIGGIQIHFGNFLCTLGFNVDHSGGSSFITNSHCTNEQGGIEGTTYYQPTSSVDGTAIAVEAADPGYFSGGVCASGKVCRYSDASRARYNSGIESTVGTLAKTTGTNNGSITVSGSLTITEQDNSSTHFSGTIQKVGRTTGWTEGSVSNTCATVNVSGSTVQLLCQTLVYNRRSTIVGGGDSGSGVFVPLTGDNVKLVGILWGGSTDGRTFVFSPLKNIQQELGSVTATGTGGGGGGGGGGDDEDPPCIPRGNSGKCH